VGLLARDVTETPARTSFPPSTGVVSSLQKSYERFTGGRDLTDFKPNQLPGNVTTKVPFNKFGVGFSKKFHGGEDFPLQVKAAHPSPEEMSYLKPGPEPAIPVHKAADVEFILRKNVRVLSSLDWLLNTLKEVYSLPNQDASVIDALWYHIRKTLSFSTDFSSGALTSLLLLRREAFLRCCEHVKVPKRTHTWATLRPTFDNFSNSLLGDTADILRKEAKEDREVALMSSLASQRNQGQSRSSHNYNNRSRGPSASNSSNVNTSAASSTRTSQPSAPASVNPPARSSRNFRRGNKGSFRGHQTRR
jgi:hypothetical protein